MVEKLQLFCVSVPAPHCSEQALLWRCAAGTLSCLHGCLQALGTWLTFISPGERNDPDAGYGVSADPPLAGDVETGKAHRTVHANTLLLSPSLRWDVAPLFPLAKWDKNPHVQDLPKTQLFWRVTETPWDSSCSHQAAICVSLWGWSGWDNSCDTSPPRKKMKSLVCKGGTNPKELDIIMAICPSAKREPSKRRKIN